MPLIKDGVLVSDPWVTVGDGDELSAEAPLIVTLDRWRTDRASLLRRGGALGIRLRSDQPPSLIVDDLDRFGVIALEFPKFTDGRAYSSARLLRERHGYRGELRAVGAVLRDQLLFMHRCGFNAFEVADESALEGWLRAVSEITVWYQPAADGRTSVLALRHRQAQHPIGARESRKQTTPEAEAEAPEPDRRATAAPDEVEPQAIVCAAYWAY